MPWLPLYVIDADVKRLCALLADDGDIALVRPDGFQRWRAHRDVPKLADGKHALWHIPSGPIEFESRRTARPKTVKDPFAGWTALEPDVERDHGGVPWFGPGPLGIIWLTIRRTAGPKSRVFRPMTARPWSAPANEVIGLSSFAWIGNAYRTIGFPAPAATEQWWKSLRRRIANVAEQIPTCGRLSGTPKSVWAFPAALAAIRAGARRADNP